MPDIELFDTHCHLDFPHYDEDRDVVIARMREAGVTRIIGVGVDLDHLPRLRSLAEAHEGVWFSVGIHPNHEVASEPTVDALCTLAEHEKCVAIGETGMDFFRDHVDAAVQASRFRTHIRAARQLALPVIVHMRDADEATLRILQEENIAEGQGIMHCFSSGVDAARAALDLGMMISFSGNVSFKNNQALRDVAAMVPPDRLLIETDSPYLAPVPYRGKRNEPTYVRHVGECLAGVYGMSLSELAAQTTANACALFGVS